MAKRKIQKPTRFERMYKVWDYLRKNKDRRHPTSIAKMRKDENINAYIGDKETINRLLKDMANIMNLEDGGSDYKPEAEWRLYFDDFKKFYGDKERYERDDSDEDDSYIANVMRIKNLYYNRTFSEKEVDSIIEGIMATRTLDSKSAQELVRKVEDNMTTVFYKRTPRHICKVQEPELADRELLKDNLAIIQKAIDDNVRIQFRFNGYSYEKKLEPVREEPKKEEKVEEVTIDDFAKLQFKVGTIVKCEPHPKADRLLVEQIDLGGEVRQIVSGIAKHYKPEELIGKQVVVVTNLKPVKLRGVESYGMILCATDDKDLSFVTVAKEMPNGVTVR